MKPIGLESQTDEQLIQEYLLGNNSSMGILYSRYYTKVYHKCLSFTKNSDDAFDFAQDILMKAFSNLNGFKGNSLFSTWLYAIAHNYCISSTMKIKRLQYEDIDIRRDVIDDFLTEEDFENRKNKEDLELELNSILANLSDLDKNLLELKYHQNTSIKELQLTYNLSASAIKMRLMRARQRVEQSYFLNKKLVS